MNLKPYQKFLMKYSVQRCGIMAPLIGGVINSLLYRPGRTVAYLGVEVFFTALTTSFICNLIYCAIFKQERAMKAPRIPFDLNTHVLYKHFPQGTVKQCAFLAAVSTVLIAALPALMLMLTGLHTEATIVEWVGCKMLTGVAYVSFSVYHIVAYRVAYFQSLGYESLEA